LQSYLISLKQNDNLPISGHGKIRILQSVEWWQTMHDLRMKLNAALAWQMQHYTRPPLIRNVELNLKKKLVNCYIWITVLRGAANWAVPKVDHICLECFEMWCWRRIELIGWSGRLKNEEVLYRITEKKNILHKIKQKKPNWTRHQFTTLKQHISQIFPYIHVFMLQHQTEYCYIFRSTRDHCHGIRSKQYRITTLMQSWHGVKESNNLKC
jgi:hypothetical protein